MLPRMFEILAVLVLFTLELPTLPVEAFEVASQVVHSGSCPHGLDKGNEKQIMSYGSKCAICSFPMELRDLHAIIWGVAPYG